MFHYLQRVGGEEDWAPVPASQLSAVIERSKPMFVTALAVNKLVEELESDQRDKLCYEGPLYVDFDGPDIDAVANQLRAFTAKLEGLGLDLGSVSFYATGSKGFHVEVPSKCFVEKPAKGGTQNLPIIYKEMAFALWVDNMDMRVYSQGRGRMWRQCNVQRPNGTYKVPLTLDEVRSIDAVTYQLLVAQPREAIERKAPELCVDLAILYAKSEQKVVERMKARGKSKPDPLAKEKASCDSIKFMMAGVGVKQGVGFHELALQLAVIANTAGMSEEQLIEECQLLIENHTGDGNRYNSAAKRKAELLRMYRYCADNPMYEFKVGAIKVLLTHPAPDLDGIPVTKEDVEEVIKEAAEAALPEDGEKTPDEFADVAGGVTLSKFGVYASQEDGNKRRICAISFQDVHLLMSMDSGQLAAYEATILVNGRPTGRQTLEMDTFLSLQMFNRFAARHGHAMQGTETHVRGVFMRFVELAKRKGKVLYIAKREGLDVLNIPNHENPAFREPFMAWADGRGVILDPRVREHSLEISFQGFPDPRGLFKTDLADAPKLVDWIKEPGNGQLLEDTLRNMLTCQRPDVMSKMLGWYTACFYRMLFHKAYNKFPLLHVHGSAGSGKCFRKGTKVLRADGVSVNIEDVKVGDKLLGPDSKVRNVLALGRGRESMYEVRPVKGAPYVVNESHTLALQRSYLGAATLSDGTKVPAEQELLSVNVKVWAESSEATQKLFKGYRAGLVTFDRTPERLWVDPYCLGAWLGDGTSHSPTISKPPCRMVEAWSAWGASLGAETFKYEGSSKQCPAWRLAPQGKKGAYNPARAAFEEYGLFNNKHIPEAYLYADPSTRLQLLAGLLDSDGYTQSGGYDWINADRHLAEQVTFLCRSLGLAAYMRPCLKGVKSRGFSGTYFRVSISGDCSIIPCKDKVASSRLQCKSVLRTGLTVTKLGVEDYYGVQIDGDHLFLLDDFTVVHNSEMNAAMAHLFFYQQEPKILTPASTVFAIQQHMAGSVSVPLLLDEYKPHEMHPDLHNKLKLMFRDAYNAHDVSKGGGTRESDDYRSLSHTQLVSPTVFIGEAPEEESAVAERVVLITVVKPSSTISLTWLARFQKWDRNKHLLAILGQYLAGEAINTMSVAKLREEFDSLYDAARSKFMLTEADLTANLDSNTLREKQGAKERSVYNFTVALFGLKRFRRMVEAIYGKELFGELFDDLEASAYHRMSDLQTATQAEWAKVLDVFSTMSYAVDSDSPYALRQGVEFLTYTEGGQNLVEVALASCYLKYRAFMRASSSKPLYSGTQAFVQSMRDCPALVKSGFGDRLQMPGVFTFNLERLSEFRVGQFKD